LTGEEETSAFQEATGDHPAASPRKFYRLTREGIEASDDEWSNPQHAVYPEIGEMLIDDYLREKRKERKYRRPTKERFLRPTTAGLFIRDYLLGLGPEGATTINPEEGDYPEHIFFHYKEYLRRVYARDAVALENKERQAKGLETYSPEEYAERLEWHRQRIPYKLHRARYHSFYRYFHWLKQLGWVERTWSTGPVIRSGPLSHPRVVTTWGVGDSPLVKYGLSVLLQYCTPYILGPPLLTVYLTDLLTTMTDSSDRVKLSSVVSRPG